MTTDLAEYRSGVRAWLADADIPTVPLDLDERFDVLRDWQQVLFEAGGWASAGARRPVAKGCPICTNWRSLKNWPMPGRRCLSV